GKNWQVGARWRYSSGTPYTPYDTITSSLISNWQVANRGIFDFERLNENRLPAFHVLDLRLDKRWAFDRSNLNVFIDIQNAYRSGIALLPYLTTVNDADFNPVVNAEDPSRYDLQLINSDTGRTLTTLGVVMEF
ncbi:MAG TPA: ferric aerobactin receptor, partial [Bacteroidetes bacterium]|nr:ferric aerobactin receptor [Bacteroidota bacterium]